MRYSLSLVLLSVLLVQLPITAQSPGRAANKQAPPSRREPVKLKRSPKSLAMGKAFAEGKLPEPARLPRGNVDQQAAALAEAVSRSDDASTAALYAAILAAGFAVRDSDGSLMQTRERGQGLSLDAWDIAATAKLYGEDYGVMLSHLSDAFMRGVPEFKDVPVADAVVEGLRAGVKSNDPSVRFLSRFIVELGKNGEPAHDLLGKVDPTRTRLNAIQLALILNRLAADFAVAERNVARLNYSHSNSSSIKTAAAIWQSPCPTNDSQDLILDYTSLSSTTLFGILTNRLGGKIKSVGGAIGIAGIVATVLKFILSYSMLDVEITMDGE
ncbi:MAG TPA: hypothetical protein VFO99_17045, partial [Pyrinomonadaceae bacterium]|nr:hypothetical protein [Pyrinomonadaceae bacterium]